MNLTPEEKRKKRLALVAAKLKSEGISSYRATCGWMMLSWGSKRETVRDYLTDLEWAGLIDIDIKEDSIAWIAEPASA